MFMVNHTEDRQQRAQSKARETRPAVDALSFGSYRVEGSGGNRYDVTVEGAEVGCNCMAGQNDKPCYHAFAALRTHETLAVTASPVPAPRDKRLKWIESDLNAIERCADQMTGDFELMDEIFRAVRAARQSLAEYELDFLPAVNAEAA